MLIIGMLIASFCFVSCSDDEEKHLDGKWAPLEWNTEVKIQSISGDGYDHIIENPPLGENLVFTCTNYESLIGVQIDLDGEYLYSKQNDSYNEDWGSVSIKKNMLNVKLNPQAKEQVKEIKVIVTVGDAFSCFTFNLAKK